MAKRGHIVLQVAGTNHEGRYRAEGRDEPGSFENGGDVDFAQNQDLECRSLAVEMGRSRAFVDFAADRAKPRFVDRANALASPGRRHDLGCVFGVGSPGRLSD